MSLLVADKLRKLLEARPEAIERGIIVGREARNVVIVKTSHGVVRAVNTTVASRTGIPVVIAKMRQEWVVIGLDYFAYLDPPSYHTVPYHAEAHVMGHPDGSDDLVFLPKAQYLPLAVVPTSPPTKQVRICAGTFINLNGQVVEFSERIFDFSPIISELSAGTNVLLGINRESELAEIIMPDQAGSITVPIVFIPLALVKLRPDQTEITWKEIVDVRELPSSRSGLSSLSELGDTCITNPLGGDHLVWDEGTGCWTNEPNTLVNLEDVNISPPADGHILTWDSVSGKWTNVPNPVGTIALDDLVDVSAGSPQQGDIISWDSNAGLWHNGPIPETAIVSIDGVSNPGGNVDLVPSDTTTIAPDDTAKQVRIGTKKLPIFVEGGHLFHFDGDLGSTRGLQPLPGYVATLRPGEGRFGGAVAVEEATTNLVTNGDMSSGTTGWTANQQVTLNVVSEDTPFGKLSFLKVTSNQSTSTPGVLSGEIAVVPSTTYTLSLLGRRSLDGYAYLYAEAWDGTSWHDLLWFGPMLPDDFGRVYATFTTGANDTQVKVGVLFWPAGIGSWFEITQVQLEQKPFATSFVNGTRAPGALEYQAPALTGESYTIALWARAYTNNPGTWQVLFDGWSVTDNGSSQSLLEIAPDGVLFIRYRDANGINYLKSTEYSLANRTEWHHYALTFDGPRSNGTLRVYVDGVEVDSSSTSLYVPGSDPKLSVGSGGETNNDYWNGLLDELLILPYAASVEEIRSWYEVQAPFYDPETWYHPGNDGTGSGLDADMVDGKHASAFVTGQGAGVRRITAQSIPNQTWTLVSFDTEDWDSDNCWSSSEPTRLYCHTAGLYVISAAVSWLPNGNGTRIAVLRRNGAVVREVIEPDPSPAHSLEQDINCILPMSAGDYIELQVYQTSGNDLNLWPYDGRGIELAMARIG